VSIGRQTHGVLGRVAPRRRLVVAAAIAVFAGVVTWLILRGGDEGSPSGTAAQILSADSLANFAGSAGYPVFWAGPRAGLRYELTLGDSGRTYVRYLPRDREAGDSRPDYLSVATYPVSGAYDAVRAVGGRPGAVTFALPGDGIGMYNRARPNSVYVAYRALGVQVEVFDPSPERALAVVKAGGVRPVGGGAAPEGPRLVGEQELRRIARADDAPVYWAGPRAKASYEFTRTVDGRAYVRYLPLGARAGERRSNFLTVGTYPVEDGAAAIRSAAQAQAMTLEDMAGGALAAYSPSRPKNVYFAPERSPVEVEAYSPTAGQALQLVGSGRVRPVR
jgi:hypothetical protein